MKQQFFDDFDEYEDFGNKHSGKKGKQKRREKANKRGGERRMTREEAADEWSRLFGCCENIEDIQLTPKRAQSVSKPQYTPPAQERAERLPIKPRAESASQDNRPTFGRVSPPASPPTITGEHVRTIRGNIIDFERLAGIEKVENEHNGQQTYGIKFLFAGNQNKFRVAWFNQNMRERDAVYNREFAYWHQIQTEQGDKV